MKENIKRQIRKKIWRHINNQHYYHIDFYIMNQIENQFKSQFDSICYLIYDQLELELRKKK